MQFRMICEDKPTAVRQMIRYSKAGYAALAAHTHVRTRGHTSELEGKYSLGSTNPRESEIRAHLRP